MVSDDLKLLSFEQAMPEINEKVLCVFSHDGEGVCLSGYFNDSKKPQDTQAYTYLKKLSDTALLAVDRTSGDMIIEAGQIRLRGNVLVEGDMTVSGRVTTSEVIIG